MKNPIEFVNDLYDFNYQYYRWFLHRRLLFSDLKFSDLKEYVDYNIFRNDDSKNVSRLVGQTTALGASTGLGLGSIKYALDTGARGIKFRQAAPASLGVFLVCTGVGLVYGSLVNATSTFRGGKNDQVNHAIAALATLPVSGVYAKTNKTQWGIFNAVLGAGFLAYLKYAYSGRLLEFGHRQPDDESRVREGVLSYHYKAK